MIRPSARSRRAGASSPSVAFHYLTAATAGGAVLVVEILGARMLAPYLGTSHFVWTAQIVVTLVALALGYDIGGRLADPVPRSASLYVALLIAAAWLAAAAWLVEPVAWWCSELDLATGSLAASAFLFFVPLTLLAMVGPFLSRLLVTDLRRVGTRVGRLLAVGTMGSVAGAILVGYVLIPFVPYGRALTLTAIALATLVLAHFLRVRPRAGRELAASSVLLLLVAASALVLDGSARLPSGMTEREAEGTPYGRVQVVDAADGTRYLLTDFLVQNAYDPATRRSVSAYTHVLGQLARIYTTRIEDALCIGMGMGAVPADLAAAGARVDVVEINPAIPRVAARWFDRDLGAFRVHIEDGRRFLHRSEDEYDVVVLDAFSGDSSPSHLMTTEAFAAIRRRLRPGGVLVINSFGDPRPEYGFLAGSLRHTLAAVFSSVRVHAMGTGNMFFVASGDRLTRLRDPDLEAVPAVCEPGVALALRNRIDLEPAVGIVLTDAHNPVEVHDAEVREGLRRQFAAMMRPD